MSIDVCSERLLAVTGEVANAALEAERTLPANIFSMLNDKGMVFVEDVWVRIQVNHEKGLDCMVAILLRA